MGRTKFSRVFIKSEIFRKFRIPFHLSNIGGSSLCFSAAAAAAWSYILVRSENAIIDGPAREGAAAAGSRSLLFKKSGTNAHFRHPETPGGAPDEGTMTALLLLLRRLSDPGPPGAAIRVFGRVADFGPLWTGWIGAAGRLGTGRFGRHSLSCSGKYECVDLEGGFPDLAKGS